MINITCSNGITTVENTDYNVMPVVKFVNPEGSYISQAKGMYNGHYYWALDGVASYGILPGIGTIYIWFNTSATEWWATDALGGGLFYDTIQTPTNTLYPLDAFIGGSFDAGTLISPANGLAKSYFNINGKFHTKETIFYVYLANDVYEIPLAKLQVNGSPQATMQDGINALAAILVNAGSNSGGGGGSALPINDLSIALSLSPFEASNYGIYRIVDAGDGSNTFQFPDPTAYPGETLIIHNSDINVAYFNVTNAPYSPDDSDFYTIGALTIGTCISYNNKWYAVSFYTM